MRLIYAPTLVLSLFFAVLGAGEAALGRHHEVLLYQGVTLVVVGAIGIAAALILSHVARARAPR